MNQEHNTESDAGAEVRDHLRRHLTDGHWHDGCRYCLNRRKSGGAGVPSADLPLLSDPPYTVLKGADRIAAVLATTVTTPVGSVD